MSNVTCYGFKCSTVSTWETALRTCCQSSNSAGRSVNEFGQYFCAGDSLGPAVNCFNQTFQAQKSQFDVYTLDCFDDVGNSVDAGVVSTSNSTAFACSKDFLSNCYDATGNKTEDPRSGSGCGDSGSGGSSSSSNKSSSDSPSVSLSKRSMIAIAVLLLTSLMV
ncbi:hypothetical protein CVT26_013820 [Gymnopilus dilepis]|uniref:Uncharacterized protein n=1 Tax=Gymnopilus dilepis TaxID=231916 RepID=A0A409Y6N0_9AGAR|nr:hypothetical protein CVT26_013820 [Gymnopilus dilepis]